MKQPHNSARSVSGFGHEKMSMELFQAFSSLIFDKTGIFLKSEKRELLNARLGKRLRVTGIESFQDYYDHVIGNGGAGELVHMIDSVSTNFTSFFRENAHFDHLVTEVLPKLIETIGPRKNQITMWSSACSSGEEPYTLGMVVDDYLRKYPALNFNIHATDISTKVLAIAERGVYPEERVVKVPPLFLKRYFQKGVGRSDGLVKVRENLKKRISFKHFNLMDQYPWQEELDVIFCRNVMIYFNRETQKELVEKFHRCLRPGGYLFIGHSESISNIKHGFTQMAATAYRK
ncbi:MAG: protein-glutamate O-methyltransferase CheR [Proteobacteria bacterium]|nr:protein-glutamate O-methyltransferase CheR [Pseudomonadota bacterium]MBU1737724.1 protein-glutamate O-methyltransferase CheR [Pseudomonadota bacterium]